MSKRIFISADHGTSVIYFLQSDVVPTLLNAVIWCLTLLYMLYAVELHFFLLGVVSALGFMLITVYNRGRDQLPPGAHP